MILAIALLAAASGAATTAPSADDAPAPSVLAPTYLAIGKNLLVRTAVIRRTLNDLTLGQDNRRRANEILDAVARDLQYLIGEVQAGRMPPAHRIAAVPMDLQAARAKLTEALGPEQNQLLLEKLRSVRGEARQQIGQLRQALSDLKTSENERRGCDAIMADADAAVEKLPDRDLEGEPYAEARQSMIDLLSWTHDKLGQVLTPREQSQLGPSFAQLAAKGPATRRSPGQG
ncbi:MAG: hypothetical protein ABSB74_07605 [Tepidisphaeraceae bacterium]|jgi:hypothetical protein